MITNLKPEERLDDLQINGYELIQHPGKFWNGCCASCQFCTCEKK